MATSTTAQYAAGEAATSFSQGGDSGGRGKVLGLSLKKRVTVSTDTSPPLMVAEAEFRASKLFTKTKKGLLALHGTDLQVLDVYGLDNSSAESASGGSSADVTSHFVLRWVNYWDLLEISFVGPATLKVTHGDTSDKPRVKAPGDSFSTDEQPPLLPSSAAGHGGPSAGGSSVASAGTGSGGSGSASIRVTYDSFTLTFRDAGIAQRAAAALLFQQAQYAAMRHWLRSGLHAGFRCDLVSVRALPLVYGEDSGSQQLGSIVSGALGSNNRSLLRSNSTVPHHMLYSCASGSYPRKSLSGAGTGAGAGGAGHAAAGPAVPYPWGDAADEWGCSVPLPAGWGPLLDAAAATSSSHSSHSDDGPATPDELTAPISLQQGPKALQVTISTPLGAAVATITPQLVKAALQHRKCREILALPLHRSASAPAAAAATSAAPTAAFTWAVQGSVGAAPGAAGGAEGSAGSGSNMSGAGYDGEDVPSAFTAGGASQGGSGGGGLPVEHTQEAYAMVLVEVVRSPGTANTRGVGDIYNPEATTAVPTAASLRPQPTAPVHSGASTSSSSATSSSGSAGALSAGVQLQLAVCALLAGLALQQFREQPLMLLLELLLLAAVAGTAWTTAKRSSDGSLSNNGGGSTSINTISSVPTVQKPLPVTASNNMGSSEDVKCCGWSLVLMSADLVSSPSRHLQLQVSLARASRGMARLRMRLSMAASVSQGGAPQAMPSLMMVPSDDEISDDGSGSMPVLVSDPEPIWLNTDTKSRFFHAKTTLESAREQAKRTDKWRQKMGVDTVLMRPCPKFPLMCRLMPTYLLADESPEGHAVLLMKIGGVKALTDAIFQTPEGSPDSISLLEAEHTLALLNEYMVQVAAPKAVPAGFQVQIYDLSGFKLSFVTGDMFALFKILVRFGLYYPERLHLALVINAPVWFATPWKAMSAFLDENTRAKVVVVGNPKSALSTLSHHLGGIHNVPEAWGGKCPLAFEDYPANRRMMEFGQQLLAGQQPFPGLRRS